MFDEIKIQHGSATLCCGAINFIMRNLFIWIRHMHFFEADAASFSASFGWEV
ncbi:MAG: hypothetical protein U0L59_07400 [Faecalimonas sp.]|nr:hypothetical protein [Faecalimonas sp.]